MEDDSYREIVMVDGIRGVLLESGLPTDKTLLRKQNRYGRIPLEYARVWPDRGKRVIFATLLFFLAAVNRGKTFPLSSELCKIYGISPQQRYKLTKELEDAGIIEVIRHPGRLPRIRIKKPKEINHGTQKDVSVG